MKNIVECMELSKDYKEKEALKGLTFSLAENKMVGLIGRNGAGKTTFLKTCAGYLKPTSGKIKIFGETPFDNLNALSQMIFVDEEVQYDESFTLRDIKKMGSICYKNWDEVYANKLLKYFNLKENLKYKKLSRGLKTQFNMIMGLASRAPLTLLDEPTLGLDVAVRKEFYHIILKDYMEHPRTFLISSHLMSELENMLEEMILIHDGKLVFQKSIEELQDYALYLNGREDTLTPFLKGKKVLHTEGFGNSVLVGIINDLRKEELTYLKDHKVEISKAKIEDIYIWLTENERRGGFDEFEG